MSFVLAFMVCFALSFAFFFTISYRQAERHSREWHERNAR